MNAQLRDMTAADIPEMAQLWHSGWHDGHAAHVPAALTRLRTLVSMTERLARLIARTRVATIDGRIAGFCTVRGAAIHQMYAAPFAQGTGVAAQLMAEGEARIKAAGHSTASLDCAIGNTRAARFYDKCGWHNRGEVTTQVDTSEGPFTITLWRFEKPL